MDEVPGFAIICVDGRADVPAAIAVRSRGGVVLAIDTYKESDAPTWQAQLQEVSHFVFPTIDDLVEFESALSIVLVRQFASQELGTP